MLLFLLARFFLFCVNFRVLGFVEFVSILRKVDMQLQEEEEERIDVVRELARSCFCVW